MTKRQWVILGFCMIQSFHMAFGKDKMKATEEKNFIKEDEDKDKQALHLNQIFRNIEISYLKHNHKHASRDIEEKATRIYKLLMSKSIDSHEYFSEDQILKMIKIIEMIQKKKKFHHNSYYIYPDYQYLWLPVQIYKNGHIYLHLEEKDKKSRQGGYKFFSRSISYDKEEIVANLEAPVRSTKSFQNLSFEIEAMKEFERTTGILKLYDYDIINMLKLGKEQTPLQIFVFQTPLYENDISVFKDLPLDYNLLYRIASNLQSFHDHKWIHRDVKPGNFFYRTLDKKQIETVIADFGLAQKWPQEKASEKSLSGTRGYIDPSICYNRIVYDLTLRSFEEGIKADIFSLGMVYLNLYSRKSSYFKDLVLRINRMALPPKGSQRSSKEEIIDEFSKLERQYEKMKTSINNSQNSFEVLMHQMLNPNPEKRPSLREVMVLLRQKI